MPGVTTAATLADAACRALDDAGTAHDVEAGDAQNVLLVAGDHLDANAFVHLVDEYNTATRDHLAPLSTGGPNALFAMLTHAIWLRAGFAGRITATWSSPSGRGRRRTRARSTELH